MVALYHFRVVLSDPMTRATHPIPLLRHPPSREQYERCRLGCQSQPNILGFVTLNSAYGLDFLLAED